MKAPWGSQVLVFQTRPLVFQTRPTRNFWNTHLHGCVLSSKPRVFLGVRTCKIFAICSFIFCSTFSHIFPYHIFSGFSIFPHSFLYTFFPTFSLEWDPSPILDGATWPWCHSSGCQSCGGRSKAWNCQIGKGMVVDIHHTMIYVHIFKGLRLTAGRRPSNDFWLMVREDWAEILRANRGRAMLRTEAGIMRSACLYGSSLGLCWALVVLCWALVVPMLGQVGSMLSHLGPIGLCWAKSGACWAMLGPSWAYIGPGWAYVGLCWEHLGPTSGLCCAHVGLCRAYVGPGSYVGAMLGPSMLKRS